MKSTDTAAGKMDNIKVKVRRLLGIVTLRRKKEKSHYEVAKNTQADWFQQIHGDTDNGVIGPNEKR